MALNRDFWIKALALWAVLFFATSCGPQVMVPPPPVQPPGNGGYGYGGNGQWGYGYNGGYGYGNGTGGNVQWRSGGVQWGNGNGVYVQTPGGVVWVRR